MTRTRVSLLAVLALLAAAWVRSWPTVEPRPAGAAARPAAEPAAAGDDAELFALEEVTARLERRMAALPNAAAGVRDPFRFAASTRAPQEPAPAVNLSVAAPAAPVPPPLTLIGVVDRTIGGKAVRVAVVSTNDGLVYVSAGDRLPPRSMVVAVLADAVELRNDDGTVTKLALRP